MGMLDKNPETISKAELAAQHSVVKFRMKFNFLQPKRQESNSKKLTTNFGNRLFQQYLRIAVVCSVRSKRQLSALCSKRCKRDGR